MKTKTKGLIYAFLIIFAFTCTLIAGILVDRIIGFWVLSIVALLILSFIIGRLSYLENEIEELKEKKK